MENQEDYLDALNAYSRSPETGISTVLENYLKGVAKNGETLFQWSILKPLIVGKMEQVIGELRQGLSNEAIPTRPNVENVRFDVMHSRILEALHKFNGAPFTIQRLCELLVNPKKHYKRSDKFMRGLEKNVLVVSTVDPFGRKVVSDSSHKPLLNGLDMNGSPFGGREGLATPLPPVPDWVSPATAVPPAAATSTVTTSPAQPPVALPQPLQGVGGELGLGAGLVSSLYTDPGEQPLAVQQEEVVEETVVTMETSEVTTGGGESLADQLEDDNHANASSSSSSPSSEDMSEGSPSASGVSSSSESPSAWPALNPSQPQTSELPASTPSDPATAPQPPLSWQPIHTSPSLASPATQPNPLNTPSFQEGAPEYGMDLVTTSSTVADTVTVSSVGTVSETVEESQVVESMDQAVVTNEALMEVGTSISSNPPDPAPLLLAQNDSNEGDVSASDSQQKEAPGTVQTEISSSETTLPMYSSPAEGASYMECDSVAGLERLVCSVEPSTVSSPLTSPSRSNQQSLSPSSSSSSSTSPTLNNKNAVQQDPVSNSCPPSQISHSSESVSNEASDEPEAKRSKLDSLSDVPSSDHALSSEDKEAVVSHSEVDSTDEQNDSNDKIDCENLKDDNEAASGPVHKTSTDSTGFDMVDLSADSKESNDSDVSDVH